MTGISRRLGVSIFAVSICMAIALSTPGQAADAKAYVVQEIQVTDAVKYKEYADQALPTVASFGGVPLKLGLMAAAT